MAGGLTLIPSYTTDNVFPSYQDRLLIKSLGVQPGIVEPEDYKVSSGSGLQVIVNIGKAFIGQTKAIEEPSNIFYNGLYNVLNPTEQNPYNSVEASTVNPQLAQIILRVYDTTELGIGGSSYARLEWLNGTPTSGATITNRNGHAELPTSSLRLADVLVPKNATSSSEFTIRDRRPWARGANSFQTRTSGSIVVSESLVLIDAANLALRIECSGKPITLSLHVAAESTAANPKLRFNFWVNSTSIVATSVYDVELVETNGIQTSDFSYTYTPAPGSYLFQPTVEGGASKLLSSAGRPILFLVKENICSNGNNGTS